MMSAGDESEAVYRALPKGFGEFLGANRLVAVLQLIEDPLQCQGDALGRVITLRGHHVYCLERAEDRLSVQWFTPFSS